MTLHRCDALELIQVAGVAFATEQHYAARI